LRRFRTVLRYKSRTGLLKCVAGRNGCDAKLTGRSPEDLAVRRAIEFFPFEALLEDLRSSGWVAGQYAGGYIECLTGSIDRMGPICHRAPVDELAPIFRSRGLTARAKISLPTGAGKTRAAVEAAGRHVLTADAGLKCLLWVARTDELREQAVQSFRRVWSDAIDPKGTSLIAPLRAF
jgi:Rad3-related DNA helicase